MKKLLSILCVALMLFALSACGEAPVPSNSQTEPVPSTSTTSSETAIDADVGLFSVDITLPASLFEGGGGTPDEYVEDAKSDDGVLDASVDDAGNVVLTVTKQRHQEMLDETKKSMDESITGYIGGDFPSIKSISYNDDLTEFDMIVNRAAFEDSFDGMAALGLYIGGAMYQAIAGSDTVSVTINCVDEVTIEVFDTVVYPDDLNEG